jgi:hypothetical protein
MLLMRTVRWLLVAAMALASGGGAAQSQTPATPVLVELFTSEGCSDCPPADTVLQNLIDSSPVAGAQVVGLGQHVDYWDRLGWKDRFSSGALTDRQREYASQFANPSIYTPQMVVDGRSEFVGSDLSAARKAVERAVAQKHGVVRIDVLPGSAGRVPVAVAVQSLPAIDRGDRADIVVAVTEDRLRSTVTRGENNGRLLRHAAVVRSMATIGEAAPDGGETRAAIPIEPEWQRDNLKIVAFVQTRKGRVVLASAAAPLKIDAR